MSDQILSDSPNFRPPTRGHFFCPTEFCPTEFCPTEFCPTEFCSATFQCQTGEPGTACRQRRRPSVRLVAYLPGEEALGDAGRSFHSSCSYCSLRYGLGLNHVDLSFRKPLRVPARHARCSLLEGSAARNVTPSRKASRVRQGCRRGPC